MTEPTSSHDTTLDGTGSDDPAAQLGYGMGYEPEGDAEGEGEQTSRPKQGKSTAGKPKKSDEFRRNFTAVFGHGIGKLALIIAGSVLILGLALGYRGLKNPDPIAAANRSEVDVPKPPASKLSVGPVSEKEAERRAERAAEEASNAAATGKTYQPGFDPDIAETPKSNAKDAGAAVFNVGGPPLPLETGAPATTPVTIAVGAGSSNASNASANSPSTEATSASTSQAEAQQRQKEMEAYRQEQAKRDKFVADIRSSVLKQVSDLYGTEGKGGLNSVGNYSSVTYYKAPKTAELGALNASPTTGVDESAPANNGLSIGNPNRAMLIKTGNRMYAETDAQANTDHGGAVIATIRGGKWDGSTVIGSIVQAQDDIRLVFNTLAPQDSRPTMRINAIALREEDAAQGMAYVKDYHTMSRYASLGAASVLSGLGRAAEVNPGTSQTLANGTVVTSTPEVSGTRIAGMIAGEIGQAASAEVRRGFSRPATFATPAQRPFVLFFMQDVFEQSAK